MALANRKASFNFDIGFDVLSKRRAQRPQCFRSRHHVTFFPLLHNSPSAVVVRSDPAPGSTRGSFCGLHVQMSAKQLTCVRRSRRSMPLRRLADVSVGSGGPRSPRAPRGPQQPPLDEPLDLAAASPCIVSCSAFLVLRVNVDIT